jgi:hypothetical protein
MDDAIDLVAVSGREGLSVADRVGLLRAALLHSPLTGIPVRSVTREIHDLKLTVGWVRGAIDLYDTAVTRGQTAAQLAPGTDRIFSPVECLLLAWRRGGHREFQRVRAAQRERGVTLWGFTDPQPQGTRATPRVGVVPGGHAITPHIEDGGYRGYCTCGWSSDYCARLAAVDCAAEAHLRQAYTVDPGAG